MIRNIIFDLGGVLLNIDYNKTINELSLLNPEIKQNYSQMKQSLIFDDIDCGRQEPIQALRQAFKIGDAVSELELKSAWNAMLLDFPSKRAIMLQELRLEYKVFLLSNTNQVHIDKVLEIFERDCPDYDFTNLFQGIYYSHLVGKRKPDIDIFQHLINKENLDPNETLFLDDSLQHILGAQKVGLKTWFIDKKWTVERFDEILMNINGNT